MKEDNIIKLVENNKRVNVKYYGDKKESVIDKIQCQMEEYSTEIGILTDTIDILRSLQIRIEKDESIPVLEYKILKELIG